MLNVLDTCCQNAGSLAKVCSLPFSGWTRGTFHSWDQLENLLESGSGEVDPQWNCWVISFFNYQAEGRSQIHHMCQRSWWLLAGSFALTFCFWAFVLFQILLLVLGQALGFGGQFKGIAKSWLSPLFLEQIIIETVEIRRRVCTNNELSITFLFIFYFLYYLYFFWYLTRSTSASFIFTPPWGFDVLSPFNRFLKFSSLFSKWSRSRGVGVGDAILYFELIIQIQIDNNILLLNTLQQVLLIVIFFLCELYPYYTIDIFNPNFLINNPDRDVSIWAQHVCYLNCLRREVLWWLCHWNT